ncbi:MAG: amylo-alpha-1,6-glucosidase [Fimbriimonadaceae bacterium]|nr:glycogen debranching enzyme family protein [Chthonomonadaceae bacterium]MCO5296943.1 amylo-alpha-1,6-glucosidase [Fimbriimonadaceae bacterium]
MVYTLDAAACRNFELASNREWLLTNGLGGYAMGTVSCANTRRYHGHLVAAITPPTGRTLLLANLDAYIQTDGSPVGISTNQYPGALNPGGYLYLDSFSCGASVEWVWKAAGAIVRKRIEMVPGENTAAITFSNVGEQPFQLTLRPLVCHRSHHADFEASEAYPDHLVFPKGQTVLTHRGVSLHLVHEGAQRIPVQGWYYRFEHMRELERGLQARQDLYCPCELKWELLPGEDAVLVASTLEAPGTPTEAPSEAPSHLLAPWLRDACRRFVVRTPQRSTLIAGYPWFTDWGRDTMIALPGICLVGGDVEDARSILRAYASQMHQGLIPNRFVEHGGQPEYNTVDATLWFVNAIYKTLDREWDPDLAAEMMRAIRDVVDWHVRGTLFGIGVDPKDGLLRQGEVGVQLTWMDAKVGQWVVTPRHGKPVEVNGLWVNALRVAAWLAERLGEDPTPFATLADRAEASFRDRFWSESQGHYLDTVDPSDASLRPNQVLAMALPFSPATGEHAVRALQTVERELLTPYGLRTLGPKASGYHGRFEGPLSELDAAYHQGTVWPWLIGPYATALVKLTGDRLEARRVLKGTREMLSEYGLGGIAEVYDGDSPHRPGGCPWQAWSVAEILRAWIEDAGGE